MTVLITLGVTALIICFIFISLSKKTNLINKIFMGIYFIVFPHIVLLCYLFSKKNKFGQTHVIAKWIILIEIIIFAVYMFLKINIKPNNKNKIEKMRLKVMSGGRVILLYGVYNILIQAIVYIFGYKIIKNIAINSKIFLIDIMIMLFFALTLVANGMLRVLCTSARLKIARRLIAAWGAFIPVINIFVMLYVCHIAKLEYDHECYKVVNNNERAISQVCKTKYPLVMVHGVGFKDLKYINYWGRIPKELMRNGATVYYGHQEGWGTAKNNAQEIKKTIYEIIKKTGAKKVNIIAHSKGGLDARYMISKLDMGNRVASLTLMCTPNRGCKFVDFACKLPDCIYKAVAKFFDNRYRSFGDKNPDFYTASRQFSTSYCEKFNEEVKDVDGVYYQSYASLVKNMFSDYVLTIPYIIVKHCDGKNDGLVTPESAKWGEFKGILKNKYRRGISHGDMIDLRRDDYKGFDVVEKYVEIVSELKNKGF